MVFREVMPLAYALSSTQIWLLGATIILLFILTSFIMYIVLKILQREDVFVRGGRFGFARVADVRLLLWALGLFVGLLNVPLTQLTWMYLIVFLIILLSYEFLFDLGALKTSVAFVIEISLTLLSIAAVLLVYSFTGGSLPFVI